MAVQVKGGPNSGGSELEEAKELLNRRGTAMVGIVVRDNLTEGQAEAVRRAGAAAGSVRARVPAVEGADRGSGARRVEVTDAGTDAPRTCHAGAGGTATGGGSAAAGSDLIRRHSPFPDAGWSRALSLVPRHEFHSIDPNPCFSCALTPPDGREPLIGPFYHLRNAQGRKTAKNAKGQRLVNRLIRWFPSHPETGDGKWMT